jgi:hypothetical protein
MCDVLLPPGVNPTAVKCIYHIIVCVNELADIGIGEGKGQTRTVHEGSKWE